MESEIKNTKKEVMRKIGRNVLNYQHFELMLKYLISDGNISGYVCDLKAIKEKQTATVMKQTLGQVTGNFLENCHAKYQVPEDNELNELEEKRMHRSFSFNIDCDEEYLENTRQALASIVAERNDLTHHLPIKFDLDTIEGLLDADRYLDQQRKNLRPEYNKVKHYTENLVKIKKEFAEYVNSGELFRQWKLADLREEYLVKLLGRISKLASRDDGWTLLNHAGQLIQQNASEQMDSFKKQYGYKKLKELILATELFDLKEESTDKGGVRIYYRLKKVGSYPYQKTNKRYRTHK